MDLDSNLTVATLVDCLIGVDPPESKTIMVQINLSLSVYEGIQEDQETADVALIFCREAGTRYTKVWSAECEAFGTPEVSDFQQRSNHDACWRRDGFLHMNEVNNRMRQTIRARNPGKPVFEINAIRGVRTVEIGYVRDQKTSRLSLTDLKILQTLAGR